MGTKSRTFVRDLSRGFDSKGFHLFAGCGAKGLEVPVLGVIFRLCAEKNA